MVTKQLTQSRYPTYTYMKGRVFYYSRKVPSDLRGFYSKPRIVLSLRTKSQSVAEKASLLMTARLEEYWLSLRMKKLDVPGDLSPGFVPFLGRVFQAIFLTKAAGG